MNYQQILKEIKKDNREAFESLVCQYNESLNAFVYHIVDDKDVAEDVVQDVFVNLWINRKKVDFSTPIKNYLYVSARNIAYNHLRAAKRLAERLKHIQYVDEMTVGAYVTIEEANRMLMEAIEKLPPRTAEVIMLSLDGLKQEKIAEQMDVTVANVKRLRAIGIEKLKKTLGPIYSILLTGSGLI